MCETEVERTVNISRIDVCYKIILFSIHLRFFLWADVDSAELCGRAT